MALDPTQTPVLVYDGDCGMCTQSVRFWERRVSSVGFDAVPWQSVTDLGGLGLTEAECTQAVQWVDADGVRSGEDAVAAVLGTGAPHWRVAGRLMRVPGIHALAGVTYRWVAQNRHLFPGATAACSLHAQP